MTFATEHTGVGLHTGVFGHFPGTNFFSLGLPREGAPAPWRSVAIALYS